MNSTVAMANYILTPLTSYNQKILLITATTTTIITTDMTTTLKTVDPTQVNTTNDLNTVQQPKEAFVTFSNNNPHYLGVLNVLLDSVHAFSTRPIIAFGIDVDLHINLTKYPRVIKRQIKQTDCGPSVFFCKIHAIVSSNLDYGVLMETDDVVNYNVDVLFDVLHVWPYALPLSPRHPDDPQNYEYYMGVFNVTKRTLPYIHAHIIWNYRALPFLKHLRSLLQQGHFDGSNFDETAVNVMLWKAGANHTLCKYDPFFTYSEIYERWPNVTNCSRYCHTAFVTLHGNKEANVSSALLTRLKANIGKPPIQTLGMGGMKYLNDTSATCCYPDSKPSPIHPLLCEHYL
ncbi:unnamed protein product [Adineta steineri]|uniref:Uncharacterized protein n=1 Tax=Adineta steineri TaxID=433720 RepID=A0A819QN15_9BILA|nr:unnamed protein product [Adineta steineri]CAF4032060.1 unnamed protein product [Adineta steineri]